MKFYHEYVNNYLTNIYPADVACAPLAEYVKNADAAELFCNFIKYRRAVTAMFERMAESDIADVFTLPPQTEENYHLRVRDAIVIPMRCVFAVLYVIGRHGGFDGTAIRMNRKTFRERLKKLKKEYINCAVKLLADGGFHFDGGVFDKGAEFAVTYPADANSVAGLVSFAHTIEDMEFNLTCYDYGKDFKSFILLNPRLYEWGRDEEKIYELYDLLRFIDSGEVGKTAQKLHEKMTERGFEHQYNVSTFVGIGASIRYQIGKYDPYAMLSANAAANAAANSAANAAAHVGLKMRTLGKHSEYVRGCTDIFKAGFDKAWKDCEPHNCPHGTDDTANCECRVTYSIDNKPFDKCTNTGWEYTWDRAVFPVNEDDFDSYFYFITQKHKKSVRKS
jgi:hypothetical protein